MIILPNLKFTFDYFSYYLNVDNISANEECVEV
jgi:hypothetical protein